MKFKMTRLKNVNLRTNPLKTIKKEKQENKITDNLEKRHFIFLHFFVAIHFFDFDPLVKFG